MNRYFFNYREGAELAFDRVGMYLPNVNAAREEGMRTWRDLLTFAVGEDESLGSAIEITNAAGETILTIPIVSGPTSH